MHYFTTGEYRAWGCKYQTPIYTDLGGKQSAGSSSSGSSRATAPASPFGPRWRVTGTGAKGPSTDSVGWLGDGWLGRKNECRSRHSNPKAAKANNNGRRTDIFQQPLAVICDPSAVGYLVHRFTQTVNPQNPLHQTAAGLRVFLRRRHNGPGHPIRARWQLLPRLWPSRPA